MERTEIRAENIGGTHHLVEVRANNFLTAGPFAEPAIAPENLVITIEKDDAVGHALQHPLVLNEPCSVDHFGKVVGIGVDANKVARAKLGKGADRRGIDDLNVVAKTFA